MVKIKYEGDRSPIRIKAYEVVIDKWEKNEVKNLDSRIAKKILNDNTNFSLVGGKESKEEPKVSEPKLVIEEKKYDKDELYALNKKKQIELLGEFGLSDDEINELKYEKDRVNKILEIQ